MMLTSSSAALSTIEQPSMHVIPNPLLDVSARTLSRTRLQILHVPDGKRLNPRDETSGLWFVAKALNPGANAQAKITTKGLRS
jgi:hypothetical protein